MHELCLQFLYLLLRECCALFSTPTTTTAAAGLVYLLLLLAAIATSLGSAPFSFRQSWLEVARAVVGGDGGGGACLLPNTVVAWKLA